MFHLTTLKSQAKPPEDFEPLYAINLEEFVDFTKDAPQFSLTTAISAVRTPEMLQAEGKLLVMTGNHMKDCSTPVLTAREQERCFGKFLERGDSLYFISSKDGKTSEKRLANFLIVPTEWHRHLTLHGEHQYLHGVVKTTGMNFDFEIPVNSISKLFHELKSNHATLRLDSECRNAEVLFKEYVATVIEAAGELPRRIVYEYAGWGHDALYHHGGLKYCTSSRILPDITHYTDCRLFECGMKLLSVGELAVTLPVLLQMVAGVLAKLFEDAGLPVQYLLCLVGPSGSKKTSLAKVVYCNFEIKDIINFTSSDRAIELEAERGHDAVTVLDDLSSVKDKESLNKLNRFLRQICDGAGRKKSVDGGRAVETVSTRTVVVVTAESLIEGLQRSGILRLFQVPVKKSSINNEELAFFQTDQVMARLEKRPSMVELFLTSFIHHVERNYPSIVRFIATYRPPELVLEADRHARVYRIMSGIINILLQWGLECGALSADSATSLEQIWIGTIRDLTTFNDELGRVLDPVKLFLQTICYGISCQEILIADAKEKFCMAPQKFMGYYDGHLLYLEPIRAFEYLNHHIQHPVTATPSDISSRLRDLNLSIGYAQHGHKAKAYRYIRLNGEQLKMLCLDWSAVQKFIEVN